MATTGQPYAFVNDNPLNATDPLGQKLDSGRILTNAQTKALGRIEVAIVTSVQAKNLIQEIAVAAREKISSIPKQSLPAGFVTQVPSQVAAATSYNNEIQDIQQIAKNAEGYLARNYSFSALMNSQDPPTTQSANSCNDTAGTIMAAGSFVGAGTYSMGSVVEFFGAATGAETGGVGFVIAGLAILVTATATATAVISLC